MWFDDVFKDQPELLALRFIRVVFGVSSSPFLLNATIHHHLAQYSTTHPDLIDKLLKSFYVDNLITGANDEERAFQLYLMSKKLLKNGGFNLRKFCTNSVMLQTRIDAAEVVPSEETVLPSSATETEDSYVSSTLSPRQEAQLGERKVLGIRWDIATDHFVMSLQDIATEAVKLEPTKREIVSLVGKFYDPLGLLSPIVIHFKIFLQELCESKLNWDEPLSCKLLEKWHRMSLSLQEEFSFLLPRCYFNGLEAQPLSCSLCGFCDSSLKAYAAVVYLVIETTCGRHTQFIASKTRVSPLKTQTIP